MVVMYHWPVNDGVEVVVIIFEFLVVGVAVTEVWRGLELAMVHYVLGVELPESPEKEDEEEEELEKDPSELLVWDPVTIDSPFPESVIPLQAIVSVWTRKAKIAKMNVIYLIFIK